MDTTSTTSITAQVLNQTSQVLTEQGDRLGLSVGEVLDRVFWQMPVDDPELAASFAGDTFAVLTSAQSDEQLCQSAMTLIGILTKTLLECGYHMEQITETVTTWIEKQENDQVQKTVQRFNG